MNGSLLKERRVSLGMTMEQLAEMVGCSVKTIQRYENEDVNDDNKFYVIIRICKMLHLSIQEILLGEEDLARNQSRNKSEKTLKEIFQVLSAENFTEWQVYYNLARQNCITDEDYYFIYNVAKRRDGFTMWNGYDENGNGIRVPRVVKPKETIDLCCKLYGVPIIINDESDVFLFQIFGGYALIKKDIYEREFPDFFD